MKKFFEKHDLVKIAFGMILLTMILTWIIKQGYFNAGELVKNDITRVGVFDFFTYGLLGMYYFTAIVTFFFVLGGFYQFLSKLGAYQKLTDSIAKKIKGKEILFSLIISFVFAAITSIINEYLVVVAFMPFIITICSKANINKISSFVTTFGAMLIGILGSTISTKIVGMNVQYLQTTYTNKLWARIVLFVVAYIIYSIFNVLYLKKNLPAKKTVAKASKSTKTSKAKKAKEVKEDKEESIAEDVKSEEMFACTVTDSKKAKTLPLIIVGILALIVAIMAYIPWTDVFKVDWFTKSLDWVTGAKLFGCPIFSYILGKVSEFGAWDLFGIQIVMLLMVLVLQICYKQSADTVIESFGEGFKKISKVVVVLLLTYVILEFAVMYPVIPTVLGKILGKSFNVFATTFAGIITSLFTCEYQYTINLVGTYFTTAYSSNISVVSFILQSTFGLVSFFAPSSAMLLVGLSYLDIPYKDWMKYIWKFLIAMLIVIIVIAFILVK